MGENYLYRRKLLTERCGPHDLLLITGLGVGGMEINHIVSQLMEEYLFIPVRRNDENMGD